VILDGFNYKKNQGGKKKRKKGKNCQISIFGFQCIAMSLIKNFVLHMCELYSQIWLNLPKDDRQFFFPISSNG
jgi:hypothetical protein